MPVWGQNRGRERRFWPGLNAWPASDGAGGERRHGEKQRGRREGDVGDGRFVNKLKFKMQFVNSIFLPIPKVK